MEQNKLIETIDEKEYEIELIDIKKKINETFKKISYVINSELMKLYYEIGSYINSHKSWGSKYVQKLSEDLKEYEGFSRSNLFYMLKLFDSFTEEEIVQQPVGQIPWGHIINIMSKCESKESRLWYINKTHENSWSRSVLLKQIKAKAYERNTIEPIVSKGIKDYDNPLIKEMIKDTYSLNISRTDFNNEKEFKDKIMNDIIEFLKELGKGFALVGKEYKLKINTKTYYLDLLFYNYLLHAFFVIEVKVGEYKVEYLGQLKNYVKMIDSSLKDELTKSTIGILLCRDADELIVRTTISDEITPLALSKYVLLDDMKKYIK